MIRFLLILFLFLPSAALAQPQPITTTVAITDDGTTVPNPWKIGFIGAQVTEPSTGFAVVDIFEAGDGRYLKLDTSNDPLTEPLDIKKLNGEARLHLESYSSSASVYSRIRLRKSDHQSVISETDPNDILGIVQFAGANTVPEFTYGSRIYAVQSDNSGDFVPSKLYLEASDDTGGFSNQVVLSDDGMVGIGTAFPDEKLEVIGNIKATDLYLTDFSEGKESIDEILDDTLHADVLDEIMVADEGGVNVSWSTGELWDYGNKTVVDTDLAGSTAGTNHAINFLYWDRSGGGEALTLSTTQPDADDADVLVASVNIASGDIHEVNIVPIYSKEIPALISAFRDIFPSIISEGLIVSEHAGDEAFDVDMTAGVYYVSAYGKEIITAKDSSIGNDLLDRWYQSGASEWTAVIGESEIDETQYNTGNALTAVVANKYYRSMFFVDDDGINWVYPTTPYDTVAQAIAGANPPLPAGLTDHPRSTVVILRGSDTAFPTAAGSRWIDVRPILGGSVSGDFSDHGNLAGLIDDDHTQYVLNDSEATDITNGAFSLSTTGSGEFQSGVTDGTAVLQFGNLSLMGNITGTDVDIAAGTGDITTSGIITGGTWTGIGLIDLEDVNSSTQGAGRLIVSDGDAFHSRVFTGDATMDALGSISLATDSVSANELADIASVTQGAGRLFISDGVKFNSGGNLIALQDGATEGARFSASTDLTQIVLSTYDLTGEQFIIADSACADQNFDHADEGRPNLYIHSDECPDTANDEWMSFYHDGGNGKIRTGKGWFELFGDSGVVKINDGTGGNAGRTRLFLFDSSENENSIVMLGNTNTNEAMLATIDDDAGANTGGGNQIIITNYDNFDEDHDHVTQTDPTLFIHSDKSPNTDNTEWVGLFHDQTNAGIEVGSGELVLQGGDVRVKQDFWVGYDFDSDPTIVFDGDTSDGQIVYDEDNSVFTFNGDVAGVSCPQKNDSIHGEESIDLAPGYLYSFGNGKTGSTNGIVVPCDGKLTTLTVHCIASTGTTTEVEVRIDQAGTDCQTFVDQTNSTTGTKWGSDVACTDTFSAGQLLNFYVISDAGNCTQGSTAKATFQYD